MTSLILFVLKENKRRILSWVCFICMLFNTLPVASFASEFEGDITEPVEVVQDVMPDDNDPVVPAAQEPADPVDSQDPSDPPADTVNGEDPAVVDQDNPQDAPAAEEADISPDSSVDIAPDFDVVDPDTNDIVPEGQDAPSAEEVVLPSLFIDFPATGVFSGDILSVSYKYTSAKNEELVISLDNIAAEIEVKYLSDEMPVETVRTEDEETGYAYYRLSVLKDEVYLIRIFVEKADEEIPYSVTITEYKEPNADMEPENIEPEDTGDALIDIPPETNDEEPEANTEPEAGMIDIFPDLPDNNDTSAFDNFLNGNTEPESETETEEPAADAPAADEPQQDPNDGSEPDASDETVEPEEQDDENTEELPAEEPVVEPEAGNEEDNANSEPQDAEKQASDAGFPDILPGTEIEGNDAFDGFLAGNEDNEEDPVEEVPAGDPADEEPTDDEGANDAAQEEENPDDFLVTDDDEDGEEETAPADETVDVPAGEEAEGDASEDAEQQEEAPENSEDEPADDADTPEDASDEEEESEPSDEETAADESESEDGKEPSEGEEAEDPEEETIDLDEETLTVIDGVYTYTGHGMTVAVETTEENALPEGAEFVLAPVSADEERVQDYIAQAAELNGVDTSAIIPYVYDMHFELDGEEVHIAEGSSVKVNIVFDNALDLGNVIAAPFYHIEGGKLVTLIQDVTQKEEIMPMRGAKGMMKAAPAKAEEKPDEDKSEEEEPKEENKTVESIDFTVDSFSDFMLTGVKGGTRAVDKYAILYSNGDLVFQDGDTPDTSRGTVTQSWLCTDGVTGKEWAGSNYKDSVINVYVNTVINFPANGGNLFNSMTKIENIYDIQNIDLSNQTSLGSAFNGCTSLQHIQGLDAWNVSTIIQLPAIFYNCYVLEDINDIEGWNLTINDTYWQGGLHNAFSGCRKLVSLDLSSWDLGTMIYADCAFQGDTLLETVDLGNIFEDITNQVQIGYMFEGCTSLETISSFLQNVQSGTKLYINLTFKGCSSLTSTIDLSGKTIQAMPSFAQGCSSITEVDMSDCVYTGTSDNMNNAFVGCDSLQQIDLTNATGFTFANQSLPSGLLERDSTGDQYSTMTLQSMWDDTMGDLYTFVDHTDHDHIYVIQYNNGDLVFQDNDIIDETKGGVLQQWYYNYGTLISNGNYAWRSDYTYRLKIKRIYINAPIKFTAAGVTNAQYFAGFENCEYIYGIDNVDLSNQTSLRSAFEGDESLIHIYGLDTWDTSTINNVRDMFYSCRKLENINDIEGWNLTLSGDSDGSGLVETFYRCDLLTGIDLSSWDLSSCSKLRATFYECNELQSVDLGNIFVSPLGTSPLDLYSAFYNCKKLQSISDIFSNVPSGRFINISQMFSGCITYAEPIDLSGQFIEIMDYGFAYCNNLPSVNLSNCTLGYNSSVLLNRTFLNCVSLSSLDLTNITCRYNITNTTEAFNNTRSLSSLDLSDLTFSSNPTTLRMFDGSGITEITLNSSFVFGSAILPPGVWERQSTGDTYTAAELKAAWDSTMADTYVIIDPTDYDSKYAILYSNGDLVFQQSNELDPSRGTAVDMWKASDNSAYDFDASIWTGNSAVYTNFIKNIYFDTQVKMKSTNGSNGYFKGLTSLEYIYDIQNWDTSNLTSLAYAFTNNSNLKHIYGLDEWDTHTITNISNIFTSCQKLDNISDISSWNLTITGNLDRAFYDVDKLYTLDLSSWDLSAVYNCDYAFAYSEHLRSVNLGNIFTNATSNITAKNAFTSSYELITINDMFCNVPANRSLTLDNAFNNCYSLESFNVPNTTISNLNGAFVNCSSLKYVDLSGCTLTGSTSSAFSGCSSLRKLDLSDINATATSSNLASTFYNTKTLAYLDLSSVYFNAGSKNANTFAGSGISKITLGSGFQFNSSTLPAGNWKRESTGEIYTAAQLKSAWNSSMADTYEKVNVVRFDGNGGTVYPTRLVKHLEEPFSAEDFPSATRDGYTFVGWFSDETAGHEVSAGDVIDQDIYFARWSENHYTLVLKKNDPNDPEDTEIRVPLAYADIYQLDPAMFTVEGKVLQEWTTSPDGTGTVYGSDERVGMLTAIDNGVVYLYAKWGRAQNVSVTFDSQGGSPVDSLIVEKNTTVTPSMLVTPVKDGSTFEGWWTDPGDGERWDTTEHVMTESVHLYARWTTNPVVTFDENGGYLSKQAMSVPYGGTLSSLPWGSDSSRTLVGFFTSPTFGEGDQLTTSTVITEDVTYYAQWGYQPYFNLAGGRYSSTYSVNTAYPPTESSLIEITGFPPVERDGYTLSRWMLPDGTTVNIGDVIDREYYPEIIAEWTRANTVTVTFDPNGGGFAQYGESSSSTLCKSYEMVQGEPLGYYPDAYKATSSQRLEFLGWFDENDVLYTRDSIINDDITLYAKWQDTARVAYEFIVEGTTYQATSMYNNSVSTVNGNRRTVVYRTLGEEFGVLPGLSVYATGATLNGKYLEGWYSDPDPFEQDGVTLKPGVEKLLPTTVKTATSTWYANIVNNVVDKFDNQTAYKYYTEWTNASNNDATNLNNNLDFHPQNTNNQTASLHMHFELNSDVAETLPVGSVRITFPKSVWKDWDGNDVGTTNISAQMPLFPASPADKFFSYAEDGNGNYVILNNKEISGGAGVDLTIAYTVSPLLVPGGAIDRDNDYVPGYNYFSGTVPVLFEIDRDANTSYTTVDNMTVLNDNFVADVREDKVLTLEMHTKVDISIAKEFGSISYSWSSSWGAEPDDSDDYFYVSWRTSSRYNINQPFTQYITEDTVHDGTVVYNGFEATYPSGRSVTTNNTNVSYYTIVTRHPKSLLDNIPATGVKLRNQVRHVANWKSGYVTDYVADAEYTIYNWRYPAGEFDKTNVRGSSTVSSITPFGSIETHAPTSPRYVTYSNGQNKILANQSLTLEWELTYDGWSSGTPILWDDATSTYSRQQRVISLKDGNNKDIMYSSGKPYARYVWEPATGNFPLSDYDYAITRLRVYLREYDGEYRNGEWGGPMLRDDYSMWNEVSIYVRYRNTEDLSFFTNVKLTGSGNALNNGYAVATVTLPENVVGWEVRYPTSYFRTYLQVNEEVVISPTAELKKYISDDVVGNYSSIIKNRGYCDIWTSDDVFADPSGVFFHSTDWTGGYNGANKEIYELTYSPGALHTNKASSSQGNVIFDVERGVQDNPIAIYGRNYFSGNVQPISSGAFYDLLPRGATVDPDTLYIILSQNNTSSYLAATSYANSYSTNPTGLAGYLPKEYYNVEFVENWMNSGRTMMIINYRSNVTTSNMATVYYLLRMSYQDVISYGTSVQNDVAFMDTSGTNRYNVTSSSLMRNQQSVLGDDATYYEEVGVMEDAVVYAVAPTNYIPVDAYSWGFFKSVNTKNGYSQEDITIPNNIYTYRLNYAQSDNATVDSMVFFDVLERGAYDNAFHDGTLERESEWAGTFDSVDITPLTMLLKQGSTSSNKIYCDPVVYYSTKAKDQFTGSDWDTSNTATWTTTMPAKELITAIAVDCTMATNGTPFVMQGRNSAMFYIRMRSSSDPADVGKIAVNQGMFKAKVNNEPNEATSDTTVTLTEEEPEIHKESDPETGTAEDPTVMLVGENLTYTLSITNTNTEFIVPNIVVTDPIPAALVVDTSHIMVHFGDTNNSLNVNVSPRASVRVAGNTLVFTINSLEPEEICYFIIPCSVKAGTNTIINNTATITSVNDVEKEIDSETTYHRIGFRVPVSKLSSNGSYAVGAVLQLWDTDANPDELIEEWVTTNEVKYFRLFDGNYKLTEVAVPDGYLQAADIEFEVAADGTVVFPDTSTDNKVVMVDEAVVPIQGTKVWKYDDPADRPASITVRLMRMVDGDAAPVDTGLSATVTEQDDWEYDFGNQPKYDLNGDEYIYSVEEDTVTGYTATYLSSDPTANGLQITFNTRTSTYDENDKFILYYLKGDKVFGQEYYGLNGESTNPAGTTIQIPTNEFWIAFESDSANSAYGFKLDQIIPVEVSSDQGNLPRYAPPAWAGTVVAEEYSGGRYPESDHNYLASDRILMHYVRSLGGDSYDIVNVKDTTGFDIPFNKINEDNELIGGVRLRLTSVPEEGDPEILPVEWITVAGQSHVEHLYPGHYMLEELATVAGYLYADNIEFMVDGEGNVVIDEATYTSVDMLDRYIDQPYPFRKVWLDIGYEASRPASVTFNLIRVSDGQTVDTVTLTSADAEDAYSWAGAFDPVPMVDINMEPIEYVVREVVSGNDYYVYHDIQNKTGFYVTFSDDSDLGTNAYIKVFPLGYADPLNPGEPRGKGELVLDPELQVSSLEGTEMAGKTYYIPILDDVEGFIISKQLINPNAPDDTVKLEVVNVRPATNNEPYTLVGTNGPEALNFYTGISYPNLTASVSGNNTLINTYTWKKQIETGNNNENLHNIDEIVNQINITSVPVTKIWEGDTPSDRPASITINAYNVLAPNTIAGSITLTTANAVNGTQWSGQITGLPMYNPDGTEAQYVLKETPVEGYFAKYEKPKGLLVKFTEDSVVANGSAVYLSIFSTRSRYKSHTIIYPSINTPGQQSSGITGTLISGQTFFVPILDDDSYSFVLTSTNRNNIVKIESVQLTDKLQPYSLYTDVAAMIPGQTGTYSNYWYYGAGGFDMADAGNVNCLIYVYTGAKGQANNGGASFNGIITNEKNIIDFPFVKQWDDAGWEDDRPDTITFTLYNANDDQNPVSTVTLTRSESEDGNAWSGVFHGVPKYNEDGTEAVYIIKENSQEYYESINSLKNIKGYLIKFSDDTNISGKTLSIYQSDGVHYRNLVCPSPAATISVPYKWDNETDTIAGKTVFVPLLVPNKHAFTVELTGSGSTNPDAHYTIESITPVYEELQAAIEPYTPSYNQDNGLVQEGQYYQITYDIEENATSYTGSLDGWDRQTLLTHFIWDYESSINHGLINRKNKQFVEINKYSETYDPLAGATLQILKKSTNAVVYEWESNIYNYQCELGAGEYILHEEQAPAGFKAADDVEFIVDNDGTILVDNEPVDIIRMFDPEIVDVTGVKSWANDNVSQRPASITVNLYRNNILIDNQNVTAADNWKYTFNDLDRYDENGNQYDYTVSEAPVYDYAVTYPASSLTESWHDDTTEWVLPDTDSTVQESHIVNQATIYGYQMALSSNSDTESANYDYFYVYFRMNGSLYRLSGQGSSSDRFGGTLANKTITVPSNDIYLVWRSDTSVNRWGVKVVNMIPITTPITNVTYTSMTTLPTSDGNYSFGTPVEYSGNNYPETAHSYPNNDRAIYHWVGAAVIEEEQDTYELQSTNGLLVTFTEDSVTEATNDTIEFFCKINDVWFKLPAVLSGDIGGAEVVVPSREFYIKWNSNSSTTEEGWQIDSISDYGPASVTVYETAENPIIGTPGVYIGGHYPERVNYDNNETIVYRYIATDASSATITDEQDRHGALLTVNITNTRLPDKQNYSVYKQNPDEELLAGAVLEITGHEDNTTYDIVPIRWTSSDSGPQVVQLRAGQYVLHEITPPTGYLRAADIPFIITAEGNMIVGSETVNGLYMTDIPNLLSIPVSKVWDDTGFSRYRPASITFDLYDTSDPTTVVDTLVLTAQNNWAGMFENVPYVYPGTEEKIEYTVVERDVEYYDEEITTDAAVLDAGVSETSANKSFVYTPAYGMRIKMTEDASTSGGPMEIIWKDLMTGKWFSSPSGTSANANLCLMATEAYLLYCSRSSAYTGIDIDSVSTYNATMLTSLTNPSVYSSGTIWDDEDIDDVLQKAVDTYYWPDTLTSADFVEGNNGYHNSCVGKDYNTSPVYQLIHVVRPAYTQTVVTQVPSVQEIASTEGFHVTIGDDHGLNPGGPAYIVWKATDGNYYRDTIGISGVNPLSFNVKSKEFYLFYVDARYASGFPTDGQSASSYSRGITVSSVSPVSGATWRYDIPNEGTVYASYDAAIKDGNTDYFSTYTMIDGRNGFLAQDPRVPTGIAFDYGSAVPWYSYNDYYSEHGEFVAAQVVAKNTFTAPPDFDVPFEKVNSNGTRIAGAHLKLFTSEGTLVAEWDSSASAAHTESLEPGTYVLRETGTPSGYITAADITFTVTNTGGISVGGNAVNIVSMTDETQPSVYVDKVDYNHQSTSITGAVLRLYDSNSTALTTWTSDGTPHDITEYVTFGNSYRLHEVSAPAGFNIMSEDITVNIASDGTVTLATTEWAVVTGNSVDGYVIKMYNNQGVHFPSTGASDRIWVYLGSVMILLASAALLIRRKRRHSNA